MSYLSTLLPHLQVRAAIFREIGTFACLLAPSMVVLTYSLQKERYTVWPGMRLLFYFYANFMQFWLEVYPFLSFSKAWSMIFSAA